MTNTDIKSGCKQVFSRVAEHFKGANPVELECDIKLAIEECRISDSLEKVDYADIWAELAAWDALSDEALGLFESADVAAPRQPTIQVRTVTTVTR